MALNYITTAKEHGGKLAHYRRYQNQSPKYLWLDQSPTDILYYATFTTAENAGIAYCIAYNLHPIKEVNMAQKSTTKKMKINIGF